MTNRTEQPRICPACGQTPANDEKVCSQCGKETTKAMKKSGKSTKTPKVACPICGELISKRAKKCPACRTILKAAPEKTPTQPTDKAVPEPEVVPTAQPALADGNGIKEQVDTGTPDVLRASMPEYHAGETQPEAAVKAAELPASPESPPAADVPETVAAPNVVPETIPLADAISEGVSPECIGANFRPAEPLIPVDSLPLEEPPRTNEDEKKKAVAMVPIEHVPLPASTGAQVGGEMPEAAAPTEPASVVMASDLIEDINKIIEVAKPPNESAPLAESPGAMSREVKEQEKSPSVGPVPAMCSPVAVEEEKRSLEPAVVPHSAPSEPRVEGIRDGGKTVEPTTPVNPVPAKELAEPLGPEGPRTPSAEAAKKTKLIRKRKLKVAKASTIPAPVQSADVALRQ